MTTTTANAARVMSHIEFCHQALWPELDVQYVSVTEQWAQMAVAGPKAARPAAERSSIGDGSLRRAPSPILRPGQVTVRGGIRRGCSASPFPASMPMSCRCRPTTATGVRAPLMQSGQEFGITPYGVEALSRHAHREGPCRGRRAQRHDHAADLGLGRMMSTQEGFIGRMMARARGAEGRQSRACWSASEAGRARRASARRRASPEPGRCAVAGGRPGLCHLGRLFADARQWIGLALAEARPRAPWRDRPGL